MVNANIRTFFFLRMSFLYAMSIWWNFDQPIYHFLLVIQIRRPEEAKARGLGHTHSEDLSGVEMPHILPANEKKPNCDCGLVQEIRRKSLPFLICTDNAHLQTFVMYLLCMSLLST